MICFAIIASCIIGAFIGFILGADYYQSHHCNAFIKDDNKSNESEEKEKEKEKITNWKFDPTALKASNLRLLLIADPYIYHDASDKEKKKMDEILKDEQPKEKENKEQSELSGLAAWAAVWCDYCQNPDEKIGEEMIRRMKNGLKKKKAF